MKSEPRQSPTPGGPGERRHSRGWTFVWAGIGILAFLAAGFFLTTTFIFRSAYTEPKQEEARTILTELYESQMGYFARTGCFSADASALGFDPGTAKRYEWAVIAADCASFTARAWANLDGDSNLDIWEITRDDVFRPLHVFDDTKDIGYRIEPRSTDRWRPVDGRFKPPVIDER